MDRRLIVAGMFVLLTSLALAQAAPEGIEAGFEASTLGVADLAWDRPQEDVFEVWTRLQGRVSGSVGSGRFWLGVLGEHQLLIGRDATGGDTEAAVRLVPWESGWEGPIGGVRLRAGHLVERWGKLDLLPVADVLNGRDLRAGLLTPPDLVRQPTPLVRLQVGGARARAELTVLPFGARDLFSLEGTDTALLRQGQLEGALQEASTWEGDALTTALLQDALGAAADGVGQLDSQLRRGAFGGLAQSGVPDPLVGDSIDVGLRLEAEGTAVEGALVGAWMRSRQPMTQLDPTLRTLLRDERLPSLGDTQDLLSLLRDPAFAVWPRTWVAGGELATTIGPVGMRTEATWRSHRVVPRQYFQATTSPALAAGVGLDYAPNAQIAFVTEARVEHLLAPPADPLLAVATDVQVAAGLQATLARGQVQVAPGGIGLLSFGEWAARLQVAWRVTDAWELSSGGQWFASEASAPRDLGAAVVYAGGPLGVLSDTDSAWLGVRWIR